jgi:hypothetical protein
MKATPAMPACTCREVSVQDVAIPLTPEAITAYLMGKESYRRTDFIVLRAGDDLAIAAVTRAEPEALFSPIVAVRVLALPHETAWVDDPTADVMNATHLARAARRGGRRAAVVRGLYEHVNFVLDSHALPLRVFDVVPPAPSKLSIMVRRVLDYADLPAIAVHEEAVDLHALLPADPAAGAAPPAQADARPFTGILTPCRVEGFAPGVPVRSLDQRPQGVEDDLLLGCHRSLEIYRHFYGREPAWVNFCPRDLAPRDDTPTVLKCCRFEFEHALEGVCLTVPWGATLRQLETALGALVERLAAGEAAATTRRE